MKFKILLAIFFIGIAYWSGCTSKRIIIQNNDICNKYLALKDSIQYMDGEEKAINEARLDMLRASCGTSSNGLPVNSNDSRFHTRGVE